MPPEDTVSPMDRIREFDLLRGFAMILILLHHACEYIPKYPLLMYAHPGLGMVGLGLFAFLTGFGLAQSDRAGRWVSLRHYATRRFWRVYVPYVAALGVFIGLFGVLRIDHALNLAPWRVSVPIHLACLQVLLFPRYPQCFTLWYVGLLALMYAAYPFLRRARTPAGMALASAAWVAVALVIRYAARVIDIRFFLYVPVFVGGILASRLRVETVLSARRIRLPALVALALFAAAYVMFMRTWGEAVVYDRWHGRHTAFFAAPIALGLVLIALALVAATGAAKGLLASPRCRGWVWLFGTVSSGAYFIYLFHRPALSVWTWWSRDVMAWPQTVIAALFPLALAGVVAACVAAERVYMRSVPARGATANCRAVGVARCDSTGPKPDGEGDRS